jgi:fructose transport system substrate-binding protein
MLNKASFRFASVLIGGLAVASCAFAADAPVIGLITKTDTNPFFVKMKEGAKQAAARKEARSC